MLSVALALAAVLAGVAGTWSPCGFSMIETIGPAGHTAGRATTIAACATLTLGAAAGGVLTYGALAVLGALLQAAGFGAPYLAAAVLAAAAAVGELRGAAILPQVRRQLPEHWRRLMPMPLAAGLYGVLLGLGFTTFVLSFGVFALAGIVFAVGDPAVGIAVGLAFGVGRALPVALVAPIADRESGKRVLETMAERPAIYRGLRRGDGIALLVAAAALIVPNTAGAAQTEARRAADPAVGGGDLAFQRPDGSAVLRRDGRSLELPGAEPALGDGRVALVSGGRIEILSAADLAVVARLRAPDADAVAISRHWLVWREHRNRRDFLRARSLSDPRAPGPVRSLAVAGRRAQIGRPSLDDNRVVYARATPHANLIVKRALGARKPGRAKATVIRSVIAGLSNPAIRGNQLLYVRSTRRGDVLKLVSIGGRGSGRTLLVRRGATLWSTALSEKRAYVTLIAGTAPREKILSVGR